MKVVKLQCVLMDNNEVMFNGRSLGFFKPEEIEQFVEPKSEVKFGIWDVKNECWLEDKDRTNYFITRDGGVFEYYNDGSGGYDCEFYDEDTYKVIPKTN